jgi:DNA replication and repair protein RecF
LQEPEKDDLKDADISFLQDKMAESLISLSDIEKRRKSSLIGPHKDEVVFFINGRNAHLFGSQGQQRTLVLLLKLAELALIHEIIGRYPILLLDDVMSELDSGRRETLTKFIQHTSQTFITTTNLGYFPESLLEKADVIELPIPGTRHVY